MNEAVAEALGLDPDYAERHLAHYTRRLADGGKYDLTIWPYHAMLGGIGHALVSAVEEAVFFHGVARYSQPDFQVKGDNPLTEHYSMLGPEVTEGPDGERLGGFNTELIEKLLTFDAVVVAGQAKSHCIAWTIDDLLEDEDVASAARRAHLPARGLHLAGGGAGRRGLHRRGERRLRALRRGRHARGAVDDPDRAMADLRQLLLTPEQAAEMDAPGTKDAAVLVPLNRDPWTIILTERRDDLRRHAGEISFPGGRQDQPDEDLRSTALREAHEEIGLDPGSVELVGALPPVGTFVTGYRVFPFVGIVQRGQTLAPSGERGGPGSRIHAGRPHRRA